MLSPRARSSVVSFTIDGEAEPAERDDIATAYLVDLPAPDTADPERHGRIGEVERIAEP